MMAAHRRGAIIRLAVGIVVAGCLATRSASAHGFGGGGLLHPLTGLDHMLAMVAVGAWSAQLGGRAIIAVPVAFVLAMSAGGGTGLLHVPFGGAEWLIALSVLALGLAIAVQARVGLPLAAGATMAFGFAHGYAHGVEIPLAVSSARYVGGFLVTTAALHVAGAVVALLVLERRNGQAVLRLAGATFAVAGLWLAL